MCVPEAAARGCALGVWRVACARCDRCACAMRATGREDYSILTSLKRHTSSVNRLGVL